MDADSSYGGSDTAQDSHSGHDNSSSLETTHNDVTTAVHDLDSQQQEPNNFYHKNEITLPVNYDEADFQESKPAKEPHYLSTANLNINDTLEHHSNLEEMNKNYKSTSYLNESPRIHKKSDEGVDNPAFQEEEYKPEVKSTFDNNKPYNGDLNSSAMLGLTSPNKNEEPLTEAVNLELINLKPAGKDVTGAYENGANGMTTIPVKKENDAEIGNPYDEYFVPVNEHRKYMRGEKLYVTMDKRNKKKRNKCLCWGLCLCIVAAAVIIGILAAVGIIGNQGPHPAQEVSARHFGSSSAEEPTIKKGTIFGLPNDLINETTSETSTPRLTPEPPIVTVSSILPSTETSMIQVPRALESQIVIDSLDFTPALADKNSDEFKNLAKTLETEIKHSLFPSDVLNYGSANIEVKVMDFAAGSVVVKYRITWVFKEGIHNAKDPIDEEMLKRKMRNILDQNNGYINDYHVVGNTVSVDRILDMCKLDSNGCEYNCSFDYNLANFVCLCPEGKYLGHDKKSCVDQPLTVEPEDILFNEHRIHALEPTSEPEPSHNHNEHMHHHDVTAQPEPEPSSEPEPIPDHHDYHTTPKPEPEPATELGPIQEHSHEKHNNYYDYPTTVKPEPEPSSEPEPSVKPEPSLDHSDHYVHVTIKPEPEPSTEPEPTSEPEPTHDHEKHDHDIEASVEPEPTSEPVTEAKPTEIHHYLDEVSSEVMATDKPDQMSRANYVHLHETEAQPEPTPEPTPEPKAEPTTETHVHDVDHIIAVPIEPESGTNVITTTETGKTSEKNTEVITEKQETENIFGTLPSSSTESHVIHDAEATPEPTSEPIANHNVITTTESIVHYSNNETANNANKETVEPIAEPTSEPVAEPTSEPTAEPTSEPVAEPTSEPVPEPNFEPIPEPTSAPVDEHSEQNTTEQKFNNEPVPEPTPEPATQEIVPEHISQSTTDHNTQNTSEEKNVIGTVITESENNTKQNIDLSKSETTVSSKFPEVITTSNIESSSETFAETSSSSNAAHIDPEILPNTENEIHASSQSTPLPVTTSSESPMMTPRPSENEFRQNHLPEEILAEPEMTTLPQELPTTKVDITVYENSENASENSIVPSLSSTSSTTEILLAASSETPNYNQTNEENLLVPISVNEQPRLLHVHNSTEVRENQEVPFYINDQTVALQPDTTEIKNITAQEMDHTTTHKTIIEHSSEKVEDSFSNNHMEPTVVESTENTSAMDNMSPFLPEIDNDTFVNKLHLGEHVIPHIQNETSDDEVTETSPPPRLDNDQMNVTNPHDSNTSDTSLKVVPFEGTENEILDKVVVTSTPEVNNESKQVESHVISAVVQHEISSSTTTEPSVNLTGSANVTQQLETHIVPVVVLQETTTPTVITENDTKTGFDTTDNKLMSTTTEGINTTLPPENSNQNDLGSVSENNDNVNEESKTLLVQSNSTNELSTSTEDLIALETTTHGVKSPGNGIIGISRKNQTAETIHGEIVETVTESVNFTHNENLNVAKATSGEEINTMAILEESTTFPTTADVPHVYEVNEAVTDLTTTEKLFVVAKTTTEKPVLTKADYEDLSVVPLNPEENEASNVNEKRVAHDSDSANDISEEHVNLDKFHHNLNDVSDSSDSPRKLDDLDINTELNPELVKYEEKSTKKSKDKTKFEKKFKLEKGSGDEILKAPATNEKQPSPFSDIRPVTEEFADSARCTYGQFHCVNGTSIKDGSYCIPENDRCDSVEDCSDGSDEIDCVKNGCPNNFQCASGQCLKRHLVCDGIQNCNDGSDETGCDHWSCRFDEFSCGQGNRCLPIHWRCDGRPHCADGSDEHNCPLTKCSEDSFRCEEQNSCIPKSWRCDGQADCMSGEDEQSCECGSDELKCAIGGGCVKNSQICDGVAQCADNSDEWNCLRLENETNKKYLEVKISNTTWIPVCSDNWNQTYSDLVCRSLGYGASSSTENIDKLKNSESYLKLKSELTFNSPILSQFEKTDSCDSFLAITCQEFSCGSHSTLDIQSARIIGGHPGVETQWPSLTLLYNKRHNLQCTSTLIAPTWALASYSCIFDFNPGTPTYPNEWTLYAGNTNFFSNTDNSTTQVAQIKRILPHPQAKYSRFEYTNDVVLLELAKPLMMTRNVTAMCLPEKDIEPRQLCVIAGWGVSKPGEPKRNQYLHYLPVPIIDTHECNSTKHYNGLMSGNKICAGYTDSEKSPCYNDEGAPLMCFSDSAGTWELQGILSHHDNCAKSKHPAIYTSVNERMRKWVINTIGQKPARSA